MAKTQNELIISRLNNLIDDLVTKSKAELLRQGHVASGRLIESVRGEAEDRTTMIVGELFHEDYGQFVDTGSKFTGKAPPIAALLRWVKLKNLANDIKKQTSIAFAIQASIKKKGRIPSTPYTVFTRGNSIPRTRWLTGTVSKERENIINLVSSTVFEQYTINLNNSLRGIRIELNR